jgi:hypothetical protein
MSNSNKKFIFNLIGKYYDIQTVAKDISQILFINKINHNTIYFDKKNWLTVYNNELNKYHSLISKCNYLDDQQIIHISKTMNAKTINLIINDDYTYKNLDFITCKYDSFDSWINKKNKIEKYIL